MIKGQSKVKGHVLLFFFCLCTRLLWLLLFDPLYLRKIPVASRSPSHWMGPFLQCGYYNACTMRSRDHVQCIFVDATSSCLAQSNQASALRPTRYQPPIVHCWLCTNCRDTSNSLRSICNYTLGSVLRRSIPKNKSVNLLLRTAICGTDVHIYDWNDWAKRTIPTPMVVGHEYCGTIKEMGRCLRFGEGPAFHWVVNVFSDQVGCKLQLKQGINLLNQVCELTTAPIS